MRAAAVLVAFAAILPSAASGCAKLAPIRDDACGNYVIDPDEDCDSHAPPGATCALPGTEHECRFICASSIVCPTGYGCGLDGVCRRASPPDQESLAPYGAPIPFPLLQQVEAADLDGDGASELAIFESADALGRRSVRLYSPRGKPPFPVPLPVPMTAAALARLANDSTDDIAFADIGGVLLLRGSSDLRGELVAYPSIVPAEGTNLRTIPLEVLPEKPGDELLTFVQPPGNTTILSHPATGADQEEVLAILPESEESIVGDVGRARFDESLPCTAIAFGFKGSDRAFYFTPCRDSGKGGVEWRTGTGLSYVTLPAGRTVTEGVLPADVDLDGHTDLLIGGDHAGLLIAWGQGDGTFTSTEGVPGEASPFEPAATAGLTPALPLAVADLDKDGQLDYVLSTGVFLGDGEKVKTAYLNAGAPWTVAVVADMNDNELVDIAAGSRQSLNIDFLNNAGGGVWNPFVLDTDGGVTHLAIGDFDGDLVTDLAMSETVQIDGVPESHVEVGFGNLAGPPGAFIQMAKLVRVSEMYSAELSPPNAAYNVAGTDKVADLVVTSKTPTTGTDRAFELRGNGARALTASLSLQTKDGTAVRPIALTTGYFGDPVVDIAALGANVKTGELHLYRIESAYDVKLDQTLASEPLPGDLHALGNGPVAALHYGAVLAGGDINGDGNAELVVVAPAGDQDDGAALVIADYDEADYRFQPRPAVPLSLRLGSDSRLSLHDLDGDGALDAVIVGGDHDSPTELVILWNDKNGGFDTAHPVRLAPESQGGVTGATCVPSRDGFGCVLYMTTRTSVYRVLPSGLRELSPVKLKDVDGGLDITSGDFDGDGVPDLAIGQTATLILYTRAPELQ
ncbi:MAG: FG-GAP-like repeat-containing protein [Polyangiaceae bacterium]